MSTAPLSTTMTEEGSVPFSKPRRPATPGVPIKSIRRFFTSLSTVIGGINALVVVFVAAVTLIIAMSASLSTINTNAIATVKQQGSAAASTVDIVLSPAITAARRLTHMGIQQAKFPLPAEHPSMYFPRDERVSLGIHPCGAIIGHVARELTVHQELAGYSYPWLSVAFDDGATAVSGTYSAVAFGVAMSACPDRTVEETRPKYFSFMSKDTNGSVITPEENGTVAFYAAAAQSVMAVPDMRNSSAVDVPVGSIQASQPVLVFDDAKPSMLMLFYGPVPNRTHDRLGEAVVATRISDVAPLLDPAKISPGSALFLVDSDGFLLGASTGIQAYKLRLWPNGKNTTIAGCTTSDTSSARYPSTGIEGKNYLACRYHMTRAPHAGLQAVASEFPGLIPEALASGTALAMSAGGNGGFYAAVAPLPSVSVPGLTGLSAAVVLVVPRNEILGDANLILPRTLLITVGVAIAVAIVSWALVWWMLRPLRPVAVRMGKAARFEQDVPPQSHAWTTEVDDLQTAFDEMAAELTRIRAFVPQSLLRAAVVTDEEDEDWSEPGGINEQAPSSSAANFSAHGGYDTSEQAGLNGSTARLSNQWVMGDAMGTEECGGVNSSRYRLHVEGAGGALSAPMPRTTPAVVATRPQPVSVLCINLRASLAAAAGGAPNANHIAEAVSVVLAVASSERGIVESFHGDRFTVSFNAVRSCIAHVLRSAIAGARLAALLQDVGYRLAMSAGVASGVTHVGNLGCDGLKRFTLFGAVLPKAAALERLCKMYDGATCLVAQRAFQDLNTGVALRTLDLVRLPFTSRPSLIANVERTLSNTEDERHDEWMYQLDRSDVIEGVDPVRVVNAAWAMLARGELREAAAKLTDNGIRSEETGRLASLLLHDSPVSGETPRPMPVVPGVSARSGLLSVETGREDKEAVSGRLSMPALAGCVRDFGSFYERAVLSTRSHIRRSGGVSVTGE